MIVSKLSRVGSINEKMSCEIINVEVADVRSVTLRGERMRLCWRPTKLRKS